MTRKRFDIGYFYAIATGLINGIAPIIFQKVMTQDPIPRSYALFIKLLVSSLILLPIAAPKFKKATYPKGFGWMIIVCALMYVACLVLLYESYHYIPPAIGVSLQYTFPLFTMGFSVLFFRFRCTKAGVAAMALSLLGVLLLSSGSLGGASDKPYIGVILAVGSAIAYAAYFLWTEHQHLANVDAWVFVTLKACLATVFLLIYILATKQFTWNVSWQSVLGLGLSGIGTITASFCLTLAIRRIGSVFTSILGSIEMIVVAVADVLFLGDKLTLRSCIGIMVVLIATVLVTISKHEVKTKKQEN